MCRIDPVKGVFQKTVCEPSGHGQVLIQVVAAFSGGSAGDGAVKVPDKFKHTGHERDYIPGIQVSCQQEIKARPAAHGTEIDDPVLIFLVVP